VFFAYTFFYFCGSDSYSLLLYLTFPYFRLVGPAVANLVEALRSMPESGGFDSRWCYWNFALTSFRQHYFPEVDSASNRNEYMEYFDGVKVAVG
jgi:hypothetical protein